MNNYYQAMSLLWMFPVTETVSFMHASPNTTFTIEQASIMRNNLMDYLLRHADNLSGDLMSLTWHTLAMMHASEIQSELRHEGFF